MTHCKIGKLTPKPSIVEPFPIPVNQEAVEKANFLLENCVSGEFRSVGIVAIDSKGHVHNLVSIANRENSLLLLGAANRLCNRINEDVTNDSIRF